MGLFDSNYDYNPLYDGGGRNDLETDIMEAESIDQMLADEARIKSRERALMGFTDEDEDLAALLGLGGF